MSKTERWPLAIVILHWGMAVIIVGLYLLGDYMVELDYYDQWYQTAPFWHKSFGLLVFSLIVVRIVTRLVTERPVELSDSLIERLIAKCAHVVLYALIFVLCVSGYLISTADGRGIEFFGWFEVPALGALVEDQEDIAGDWHEWFANAILVVAFLHGLAALKHHYIDRDAILKRMLGVRS